MRGGPFASQRACLAAAYHWDSSGARCVQGTSPEAIEDEAPLFQSEAACLAQRADINADKRCAPVADGGFKSLDACREAAWFRAEKGGECTRGAPSLQTPVYESRARCLGTWFLRDKRCVQVPVDGGHQTRDDCLWSAVSVDRETRRCRAPAEDGEDAYADMFSCESEHPSRAQVDPARHRCVLVHEGKHADMAHCLESSFWLNSGTCQHGAPNAGTPVYDTVDECQSAAPGFDVVDGRCAGKIGGDYASVDECRKEAYYMPAGGKCKQGVPNDAVTAYDSQEACEAGAPAK